MTFSWLWPTLCGAQVTTGLGKMFGTGCSQQAWHQFQPPQNLDTALAPNVVPSFGPKLVPTSCTKDGLISGPKLVTLLAPNWCHFWPQKRSHFWLPFFTPNCVFNTWRQIWYPLLVPKLGPLLALNGSHFWPPKMVPFLFLNLYNFWSQIGTHIWYQTRYQTLVQIFVNPKMEFLFRAPAAAPIPPPQSQRSALCGASLISPLA